MKTILQSIILSIVFITFSFATTINVPADIDSIQGGINMAVDGDTVLVQPNTYYENINFNGKNIIVASAERLFLQVRIGIKDHEKMLCSPTLTA